MTSEGETVWHTQPVQDLWNRVVRDQIIKFHSLRPGRTHRWLEIGSFRGHSADFIVRNYLSRYDNSQHYVLCVDPWFDEFDYKKFLERTAPHGNYVRHRRARFSDCHAAIRSEHSSFFGVYIDGDHCATSVIHDAVNAWPLVEVGGVIVFDDYNYSHPMREWADLKVAPQVGIDAFLACYATRIRVLHKGSRQVIVRKEEC